MPDTSTIDDLANEIRRVDGSHDLGAGALAEALAPWLAAHDREVKAEALREFADDVQSVINSPLNRERMHWVTKNLRAEADRIEADK